jgi:hypothetical protein
MPQQTSDLVGITAKIKETGSWWMIVVQAVVLKNV